jgi:hypothetical protein
VYDWKKVRDNGMSEQWIRAEAIADRNVSMPHILMINIVLDAGFMYL